MPARILSRAAFLSTLAGGLLGLRFRRWMHFILSFTAGVLLGVVSFDLLPEMFGLARKLGADAIGGLIALVLGVAVAIAVIMVVGDILEPCVLAPPLPQVLGDHRRRLGHSRAFRRRISARRSLNCFRVSVFSMAIPITGGIQRSGMKRA